MISDAVSPLPDARTCGCYWASSNFWKPVLLLGVAMSLSVAPQYLSADDPQLKKVVPRGPGPAPLPKPPRIDGKKPQKAKLAVDNYATRVGSVIGSLAQQGKGNRQEDILDAELDVIQDLVDEGSLADAQKRLDEFQKMLADLSEKKHNELVDAAFAAVIHSHQVGDEGLGAIPDLATFDRLSYRGHDSLIEAHLRGIEYVKFYIDGIGRGKPKIHFMNTEVFRSHRVYMRAARMSMGHGGGGNVDAMLGSLCYRRFLTAPDGSPGLFTFEFDPNDAFSFDLVKLAHDLLVQQAPILRNRLAYYPLPRAMEAFNRDKRRYRDAQLPIFFAEDIYGDLVFLPLNRGTGVGRLRLMVENERPSARDIVLYRTLPNDLPRVAGIITDVRQSPLSHVNLRAVQDSVPNAFVKDATMDSTIASLIGKYVHYEVTELGYHLNEVTSAEVEQHFAELRPKKMQKPNRDLTVKRIRPLHEIEFADAASVGVKAANVATLRRLGFPEGTVPDGFAVPFSFYDGFMRYNGLYAEAKDMWSSTGFREETESRMKALAAFRARIIGGEWPVELRDAIVELGKAFPAGTRIRCRSSTNNEGLPAFSGAGLYDSFTHAGRTASLAYTIKKVYASLWNFRAFEEREFYRVDHASTAMGVLVHPSYTGELANGVAVTDDIVYESPGQRYYVNVQVGEDAVTKPEEFSIAEELLLSPSAPNDDALVRRSNRTKDGSRILGDKHLDQLRQYLGRIQRKFRKLYDRPRSRGKFSIEIEIKITADGVLAIKQARPWVY